MPALRPPRSTPISTPPACTRWSATSTRSTRKRFRTNSTVWQCRDLFLRKPCWLAYLCRITLLERMLWLVDLQLCPSKRELLSGRKICRDRSWASAFRAQGQSRATIVSAPSHRRLDIPSSPDTPLPTLKGIQPLDPKKLPKGRAALGTIHASQ